MTALNVPRLERLLQDEAPRMSDELRRMFEGRHAKSKGWISEAPGKILFTSPWVCIAGVRSLDGVKQTVSEIVGDAREMIDFAVVQGILPEKLLLQNNYGHWSWESVYDRAENPDYSRGRLVGVFYTGEATSIDPSPKR